MDAWLDGLRMRWDSLNKRERQLAILLGVCLAAMLMGLPLFLMATANGDIRDRNDELRALLEELGDKRETLHQASLAREKMASLYRNKTPPLGSFIESQAKQEGLTLREVTDQPEKTVGKYRRRSVRVSIPGVDLTKIINLMSGIVGSNHPVAIDHIQLDHHQPGDKYNLKLGVLTFDKQERRKKQTIGENDETGPPEAE